MNSDELERALDQILGQQAAIIVALGSLIATHPNHQQAILHMASAEGIADGGQLWASLNDRQRSVALQTCSELQRIEAVNGRIDPLANFRNSPRSGG